MEEKDILRKIEAIVCAGEEVKPEWMHRTPRGRNYLTIPKQIIMTLARQVYNLPYACIGGFYNRNHETAMSSETVIMNYCDTDREFKIKYEGYAFAVGNDMPGLANINVIQVLVGEIGREVEDIKKRQNEIDELLKKLGINVLCRK